MKKLFSSNDAMCNGYASFDKPMNKRDDKDEKLPELRDIIPEININPCDNLIINMTIAELVPKICKLSPEEEVVFLNMMNISNDGIDSLTSAEIRKLEAKVCIKLKMHANEIINELCIEGAGF